jgi:esterase/lipase superfamily enzyme
MGTAIVPAPAIGHAFAKSAWQAGRGLALPASGDNDIGGSTTMADLSPAAVAVAVLLVAAILYACIWYATRGLSRFAQMLAMLAPVFLLIPALLYMAMLSAPARMAMAPRPAPAPSVESAEIGRRAEAEAQQRALEEARRRAAEAENSVKRAIPRPPEVQPESRVPMVAPQPVPPEAPQADWDVVPVFYGTDRVRKDEPKRVVYTSDRARKLELGRALVTVPRTHQVPNIERPFAIRIPYINVTIYEQAEDPKQHFTVQELKALDREEFIALARARIGGSDAFKDQAVVFVHGYNTEFDYALFRTAQMAYDLKFDGIALLYSWPSASGLTGYYYDRESSEQAEPYLRDFIELVVKDTGAKSVSVIAHSMGNVPLLRVLQALGPSLPPGVRLNQVILAAPDVDRNLFENLAANLRQYGNGITLYCSANDRAMEAARRVAGGIPRAGDVPSDGPLVIAGIDTIDITQASTDTLALNHSSYAEKSALLKDIGLLLLTGERPPDRRIPDLQRIATPRGEFWRYALTR